MKKVVVVGCGFGGLQFVKHLKKNKFDILIIDKINHHQFPPLFYQVASSQIEPSSISFPIRRIFQNRKDVRIRMAEVLAVNSFSKIIETTIGEFRYDYLVIATGTKTNFYGNTQIEENTLGLKSTYQAINVRNYLLSNFEKLLYKKEKEALHNIVIVGGGATGVELAGAFIEIKKDVLPKDYPNIGVDKVNVYLLEGGPHTLSAMSKFSQNYSEKYLRSMGVNVKTGVIVENYDGENLTLNNGEVIQSQCVIWSAGVIGNMINGIPVESVVRGNRIKVDRQNRVQGLKDVFAIGDIAYMETEKYPKGHPQVANVAIGQGKTVAKNINAWDAGKSTEKSYEYRNLGAMATVGRNKAVVDFPFISLRGYFAWLIWMFLHLMLILSVKNKLIIFINWAWNYITRNNSLRLILKDED